jgi:putative PIN family toxin of toxin-antitoxin system
MVAKAEVSVPRIVLDTNAVLSALLFKSERVGWLVSFWTGGRIVPLVPKATASELIRVLAYSKFRFDAFERQTVLAAFLPYAETVKTRTTTEGAKCRDPHAEMFLTLAAQGHADFLVTGDADLLSVEAFLACPILTPEQFRQRTADM